MFLECAGLQKTKLFFLGGGGGLKDLKEVKPRKMNVIRRSHALVNDE